MRKLQAWIVFTIVIVALCCRTSYGQLAKKFVIHYGQGFENDFSITVDNVEIFQHTPVSPMVFVGSSQVDFTGYRGNFFIDNYAENRVGLPDFVSINKTDVSETLLFQFGNVLAVNITFETTDTHPLVVTFGDLDPMVNGVWLRVVAMETENVYGLGEQYSYLNLRGRTYPIWTREQGVGRNKSDIIKFYADKYEGGAGGDYHTTYFPQTTFVSSRRFYCHYGGKNYAEVNLQSETFHEVFVHGKMDKFYFDTRATIKELVGSLATYLGLQPRLPDWVHTGAILGIQGGTEVMMQRFTKAKANGVAVSGIWIQDWVGVLKTSFGSRLFWDWHWNKQLYPDLDIKIRELKQQGVRVLAYINPNLIVGGDLYKEGAQLGMFVKNNSGVPLLIDFGEFYCSTVDFTNPMAFNWYKEKIQTNLIDLGFSGWMADFGEYLPPDGSVFFNQMSGRDLHNEWPRLWAEVNRVAIDERNVTGDVVFWMRAGAAGTGNFTTLMWAGDQNVDWSYADGLPSTIPAALSMGMSGVGLTHFDIGGYTTAAQLGAFGHPLVRGQELLLRSAEAAVFTPMFRSHEGNQPQANVQFYSSDAIEKQFGRLSQMYVFISNYTRHVVAQNALNGVPAQRPLFMEFPDDVMSREITYQYMYGSDLLVAPVIQPNVSTMSVYLPPGSWNFIWDKVTRTGGQYVSVPTPMGNPPAFYKTSSAFASMFGAIQKQFGFLTVDTTKDTPAPIALVG